MTRTHVHCDAGVVVSGGAPCSPFRTSGSSSGTSSTAICSTFSSCSSSSTSCSSSCAGRVRFPYRSASSSSPSSTRRRSGSTFASSRPSSPTHLIIRRSPSSSSSRPKSAPRSCTSARRFEILSVCVSAPWPSTPTSTRSSSRRRDSLCEVGLQNIIDLGVKMDAVLTYDLLVTIFDTHTPLHDGAVIIRGDRIAAAGCFLPLTLNPRLSKELGTRHRAAIGITEDGDAVAVVVSEETGTISFVSSGAIARNLDSARLRESLRRAFTPRGPIGNVIPVKGKRRRRRKQPDIETTAEMASEVSSGG
ncbi:MAG: DNA integrity scanning protein DisA nucleotide-binding domain protein [Blastocatellia bacterium]|nr:DNA integrity scanning protein DisA nucleotide-binding domain protein [Blastocatellia bacterium]